MDKEYELREYLSKIFREILVLGVTNVSMAHIESIAHEILKIAEK